MTAKLQLIGIKKNSAAAKCSTASISTSRERRSLVIIGGSGQGKSVTLKCALGLMKPDAGQVLVDGADVTKMPAEIRARVMRKFGMLFQGGALFDSLTVWENIAFRLIYADKVPRNEARERAIETMRKVRLAPEFADVRPIELSGGMQKRAGLARAIIAKPDILFFDEPTTGLDPITADAINDLIVEMVKELAAPPFRSRTTCPARAKSPTRSPCCTTAKSSGAGRRRRSTPAATRWSINSSPAAPKGRSRLWCDPAHPPRARTALQFA
jgi:phospholipid/cholesterol/gamma-HCH transport system ATP-binding protein